MIRVDGDEIASHKAFGEVLRIYVDNRLGQPNSKYIYKCALHILKICLRLLDIFIPLGINNNYFSVFPYRTVKKPETK